MQALRSILPALTLAFAACQPQPSATAAPPVPLATAPPTTALLAAKPTVARQLSMVMSGYWVSAEYLDEVARTRSPEKAFAHTPPGPSSLQINPFADQQDSVALGASYGLHEGGTLLLLLATATKSGSVKIKYPYGGEPGVTDELSYRITPTDTTLLYTRRRGKTQQLLSSVAYRRTGIPGRKSDLEAGVYQGINRLLMTGRYSGTDSLQHSVQATFSTEGTVTGLPFRKYLVQMDFMGPNPGNTVIFDVYTQHRQEFAASFGRDTLRLYTIDSAFGVPPGGTDTTELFTRGRLRYQLVRVRKP